jgi:hypothetical protein
MLLGANRHRIAIEEEHAMRSTRTIAQALAAALAAGLVAAGPAGAEILTPNLIENPGAELGTSLQGGVVASIPSWERSGTLASKLATVVDYGAPGFPTLAQGAAIGGGSHFFAGGPADGHDDNTPTFSQALLSQDVDIPTVARNLVKAGGAEVTISACLGGYADQDDGVNVLVYAYTGEEGKVGVATLKGPRAADRHNTTGLLPRSTTAKVPLDTRVLEVELDFDRASGVATYNDGYADNVSIRIATAGSTPPEPECSPIPAPAPTGAAPSPSPAPAGPAPTPVAVSSSNHTRVGLARVGTRLKLRGRVARLKLRCIAQDRRCVGTVSLKAPLGKLGSARFSIAPGKVGKVDVWVSRRMRHRLGALSRRRLAKLTVTATARAGAAATRFTLRVTR